MSKKTRNIIIAVAVLLVVVVALVLIMNQNKPQAQAGDKTIQVTVVHGDETRKDYSITKDTGNIQILSSNMYWEIPELEAYPGETVFVPVYVYNDVGCYGMQCSIDLAGPLSLIWIHGPYHAYENWCSIPVNPMYAKWMPAQAAPNGSIIAVCEIRIPADANPGRYDIIFKDALVYRSDGATFTPTVYNGSIIVNEIPTT